MAYNNICRSIQMFVICWIIYAPILFVLWICYLPVYFVRLGLSQLAGGGAQDKVEYEIEVKITESESANPKDELLFIHGYPDDGTMWDKQVEALKKDYRCIVLTLPGFGNDHEYPSASKMPSFPEMVGLLAKVIEQKSNNKKVTLIIHDWGSCYGLLLQKKRPDLVSRIATLDVGADFKLDFQTILFNMSYNLFLVLCYSIGNPVGTLIVRLWFFFLPQGMFGKKSRDPFELRAQMCYPYYWIFNMDKEFYNPENDKFVVDGDRCPIYYVFGKRKGVMFHTDNFLADLDSYKDKGCRWEEFDCGHWLMFEKPDQLNKSLLKWLDDTNK